MFHYNKIIPFNNISYSVLNRVWCGNLKMLFSITKTFSATIITSSVTEGQIKLCLIAILGLCNVTKFKYYHKTSYINDNDIIKYGST